MRRAIINIVLVLAILGTAALGAEAPKVSGEKIRVACVGDSITFGAGIRDRGKNSYPAQLQKVLGGGYVVKNYGVNAATMLKKGNKPYWKLKAFQQATQFEPNIVVIKLGTNDSKPPNWKHEADFADDLRAMLAHFAALPSKPKIWLCLPVPVYRTRWGINEATVKGKIAPIMQQVAADKKLPTIDLHTALSGKPGLFPDGIHPNAQGAALMAETIRALLTRRSK